MLFLFNVDWCLFIIDCIILKIWLKFCFNFLELNKFFGKYFKNGKKLIDGWNVVLEINLFNNEYIFVEVLLVSLKCFLNISVVMMLVMFFEIKGWILNGFFL